MTNTTNNEDFAMNLLNNTILITGGGTGIGRALAEQFYALGNKVIITGRRESALYDVTQANPGMVAMHLDISDAKNIREFSEQITKQHPSLNVIIHNAGIMRNENLLKQKSEWLDAEETFATNLLGPIRLTNALLPLLLKQQQATIMTVTSGLAYMPLALTPSYCASKAAIHSYTESLRYQLKDTAVEVLELVPPYVQTGLMGDRQANDPMAMPLTAFIEEVMTILRTTQNLKEICVERVKPQRFAAKNENYDAFFTQFNDTLKEIRKEEF
jgi:uncharacterized oxidoreductase